MHLFAPVLNSSFNPLLSQLPYCDKWVTARTLSLPPCTHYHYLTITTLPQHAQRTYPGGEEEEGARESPGNLHPKNMQQYCPTPTRESGASQLPREGGGDRLPREGRSPTTLPVLSSGPLSSLPRGRGEPTWSLGTGQRN